MDRSSVSVLYRGKHVALLNNTFAKGSNRILVLMHYLAAVVEVPRPHGQIGLFCLTLSVVRDLYFMLFFVDFL